MNQSLLILADFAPFIKKDTQTIGIQSLDLEKLFNTSNKGADIIYLLVHPDIKKIFKDLLTKSTVIRAAGGVVKNGQGEYLFIHRLGKWDLPKGKVEEHENMRKAAVREVEEECGITVDYLGKKHITTYHTYYMGGKFVLKQTNWYEMGVNKEPKLVPQKEEDISDAKWVKYKAFGEIKSNTYPLINEILETL